MTRDVYVWIPGKLGLHLEPPAPPPETAPERCKRLLIEQLEGIVAELRAGTGFVSRWSQERHRFGSETWNVEVVGPRGFVTIRLEGR